MWKGKIKEFQKDELVFEGELLDGNVYNGKGKKYDSCGNKIFEGEYINGKINGYVKKYDNSYRLEFEYQFINCLKNGIGKEYERGNLAFEGEFLIDE